MTYDISAIPRELVEAYKGGRCALFVGAGASQASGYLGWSDFLQFLIDRCVEEREINDDERIEYEDLIKRPGKQLMLAGELKELLGSKWDGLIEEVFLENELDPADVHSAIVELEDLSMAITTNYDTLLERAYAKGRGKRTPSLSFNDGGEIRRRLIKNEFFILKAHGDAAKPGNGIIITVKDYRSLGNDRAYRALLSSIFTMKTILFVGVSFDDPELMTLLDYLSDTFESKSSPLHYALMASSGSNDVETKRWRRDYNIQIIPFSPDNNYAELPEALKALNIRSKAV